MCSHRQISGSLAALIALVATAQTPYPELTIQDVAWNSGTHHYAVSHRILSPGTSTLPANISGTADAEFVSATSVRLAPGFHAGGFSTDGRFRARIGEGLGQMGDVVIIPEEPYSYMADNIAHVHKWEKLEVGLRLPQQYQNAVDAFFEHYYSNGVTQLSTPGMVDPIHHLNPYADDSLQLVMLLTDPDGQPRMKWGYFMREAKWESEDETAPLVEDTDHPLHPYHIRFRFAPDKEGPWSFTLSLQAPHTQQGGALLPAQFHSGFNFHCDPPEPDNKGHLRVHDVNHRILQFEDDTPFIGLGVNMADRHRPWAGLGWGDYYAKRDHDQMVESMAMLQDVGGNFLRMYLLEKNFSPEFVNLGVYDSYKAPATCNNGTGGGFAGSCQNQSWAFDELLDEARRNNLYIQLCVDPYPPGIAYEKHGWGANPYLLNFMKPRDANNRYDMKKFFFTDGDTTATASGPFYFWKRKYKYLMSRWGYSVNIAALEPFNEIDQMLTYRQQTVIDVAQCTESMGSWNKDDDLPHVVDKWFTKIADHVRRPIDLGNPLISPLGEAKKLFLASYTGSHDAVDPGTQDPNIDHYRPFDNSRVDLMSVHRYFSVADDDEMGMPDRFLNGAEWQVGEFRRTYPLDPGTARKPFTHGEMNYSSERTVGSWRAELEKIFHNYDVSFHNEIWSSAFSGKFTTGTTWHWERVFWWEDALRPPPNDFADNPHQLTPFSNVLGATNILNIGGDSVHVKNRRIHHHFKPLADLLSHPSWIDLQFFSGDYTVHKVYDDTNANEIEAYYLKSADNTTAIGWVHNRNAWVMNNFYLRSNTQNFLGCETPNGDVIVLDGFEIDADYFISWFPTRLNSTIHPHDTVIICSSAGTLVLDLADQLGGTAGNYLDTLHADYAFIITREPFIKSLFIAEISEVTPIESGWDYSLYPNPARDELFMRFRGDSPKDIAILDMAGRWVASQGNISGLSYSLSISHLAKGAYWVRVCDGENMKAKKLIIH